MYSSGPLPPAHPPPPPLALPRSPLHRQLLPRQLRLLLLLLLWLLLLLLLRAPPL